MQKNNSDECMRRHKEAKKKQQLSPLHARHKERALAERPASSFETMPRGKGDVIYIFHPVLFNSFFFFFVCHLKNSTEKEKRDIARVIVRFSQRWPAGYHRFCTIFFMVVLLLTKL